ncbi:MAG: hypothetical protein AAFV53_08140 [Myxococcota bacterium]
MEGQFWGYEGGNLFATMAAAGGVSAFFNQVGGVLSDDRLGVLDRVLTLTATYPDATVTIGLGVIVVGAPLLKAATARAQIRGTDDLIEGAMAVSGLLILLYALSHDTSLLALAATHFVIASSFLRQGLTNAFLIKIGSVFLSIGGVLLAAFGGTVLSADASAAATLMNLLTVGTGVYVTLASLLAYEGGVFVLQEEIKALRQTPDRGPQTIAGRLLSIDGGLSRMISRTLDGPILWINRHISNPAIAWVGAEQKRTQPFSTGMWARLPWRLATGAVAVWMGDVAFAIANLGWAFGDVCLGSLDWDDPAAANAQPE